MEMPERDTEVDSGKHRWCRSGTLGGEVLDVSRFSVLDKADYRAHLSALASMRPTVTDCPYE